MIFKTTFAAFAIGIVSFILFVVPAVAQGPNCSADKARFSELHNPLSDRKNDDRYESLKKERTNRVKDLITFVILRNLAAGADSDAMKSYLQCMMGTWRELSNTPAIFKEDIGRIPTAVSAVVIARDGGFVVDTKPVVQCFAKKNGGWAVVGEVGDDYDRKTFDIHRLKSPVEGELWYLLSGRTLGDTGGRLLVEVVACDGSKLETKWKRDNFRWGKALVTGNGTLVEISYEKLSPHGPVPLPPPPPTTEVLTVTKKGLE